MVEHFGRLGAIAGEIARVRFIEDGDMNRSVAKK